LDRLTMTAGKTALYIRQ